MTPPYKEKHMNVQKKKKNTLPFSTEVSDTASSDCFIGEEAFTGAGMVKGKDGGASETSDSED